MSLESALQEACAEWRRLAEAEGEAIRAANWPLVADCQSALRQLQDRLGSRVEEARCQWADLGPERAQREEGLRGSLAELLALEEQNLAWLASRRRWLSEQVDQLGRSSRNLRLIHQSYAPALPAGWTSLT
jgi:hypothetical protein